MSVDLNSRSFKIRAWAGSLIFLIGFALAIGGAMFLHTEQLMPIFIMNVAMDLCAMILGYILYICAVLDKQWNGANLDYFLMMIITVFVGLYADEICWLTDGKPELRILCIASNTVFYCVTPIVVYLFWRYVLTFLNVEKDRSYKFDVAFRIGLGVSLLVRLLNIFFGYLFTVDANGVYHRSSTFTLAYIYSFAVTVLTLILVVVARKRFKRYQIIALFIYTLVPVGVGIVSIFIYGISLLCPVYMTTLLLIYCILNVVQGQEKSVAENELHMAAAIQETMLPSTFPPYPDRHEFDIFASMSPAKEVGGDFYDFFLIDDDHLALVIADVSGKGVPAALYMMVTKAMIKSQTLVLGKEGSTSEILCNLNDQLCEKNTLNMFVTVWLGIVTISTGELIYSNAGHEYPIFKRGEEPFSVLKEKHSPPLGCMEGIKYKEFKTKLDPGDIVFLYTDGVAEATNRNNELFGLDRMLKSLNDDSRGERAAVDIDFDMRYSVDLFVNGAPQYDDLTMLTFKYYGGGPMNKEDSTYDELTVKADVNNLDKVQGFIDERLETAECSMKAQTQIDVAVEEIYVNICHYAYKDKDGKGDADIKMKINDGVAEIVFEDSGIKYDPLSNVEPDITLSAEEREIGGLGIFITKKTMDEVLYEYKDGRNVLTLRKKI